MAAGRAAEALGIEIKAGAVHTADLFYAPEAEPFAAMKKMGVLAVEMEAAGLYGLAAELGVRAMAIMTVSDHVVTGEATSSEERQTSFNEMVKLGLEALRLDAS